MVDAQNKKWIGTKKGLVAINNEEWLLLNKKNTPLKTNIIKSIVCDDYDRVWVSTESEIISYDGVIWKKQKTKNKKELIINFFIDDFDNKWICTPKRVIVYNLEGVEFKNNNTNESSVVVSK